MDGFSKKSLLRKNAANRRALPRTSVLWNALVASSDGRTAFNCVIRNISERGAEITSGKRLELNEQIYLLVTRNQIAYLASVVWTEAGRVGLLFGQSWDLHRGLPEELNFLRQPLTEAKLSQMLSLVKQGLPLEEAAGTVGWTAEEMEILTKKQSVASDHDEERRSRRVR